MFAPLLEDASRRFREPQKNFSAVAADVISDYAVLMSTISGNLTNCTTAPLLSVALPHGVVTVIVLATLLSLAWIVCVGYIVIDFFCRDATKRRMMFTPPGLNRMSSVPAQGRLATVDEEETASLILPAITSPSQDRPGTSQDTSKQLISLAGFSRDTEKMI